MMRSRMESPKRAASTEYGPSKSMTGAAVGARDSRPAEQVQQVGETRYCRGGLPKRNRPSLWSLQDLANDLLALAAGIGAIKPKNPAAQKSATPLEKTIRRRVGKRTMPP